ncbi:hypothetical protein BDQ12DRAFT_715178 [Crucibulum laeve]|uniref:C2H2-type domain-containing protein n=1 Tax=Crucibulum laeve TaxID=68775 RepID=A0A5C3LPI8_9AGAR|nr:hypothetical protein BDQ12DRAFT_715178 [Crucibulum laeve]
MAPFTNKAKAIAAKVQCTLCAITLSRKSDMRRHMLIHKSSDKDLYKCDYAGCSYAALQKKNLETHTLTHTGEKPYACPSCSFATADPGSLTRHRKTKHNYVPTGKSSCKVAATKKSSRHEPYSRSRSSSQSTDSSWSTSSPSSSYSFPTPPATSDPSIFELSDIRLEEESIGTCAWNWAEEIQKIQNACFFPFSSEPDFLSEDSFKQLFPAVETVQNLQGFEREKPLIEMFSSAIPTSMDFNGSFILDNAIAHVSPSTTTVDVLNLVTSASQCQPTFFPVKEEQQTPFYLPSPSLIPRAPVFDYEQLDLNDFSAASLSSSPFDFNDFGTTPSPEPSALFDFNTTYDTTVSFDSLDSSLLYGY